MNQHKFPMLPGKTLVIGPSRAGKTYFSTAFKGFSLVAVDADKDTDLLDWRRDATGETVAKPRKTDHAWFTANHFTVKPDELSCFLAGRENVIMFAHCWNIMDVIGQFDRVAYMSLSSHELERRLRIDRPDHKEGIGSPAELEFFRERHRERSEQAKRRGLVFIDATLTPAAFYGHLRQIPIRAQ